LRLTRHWGVRLARLLTRSPRSLPLSVSRLSCARWIKNRVIYCYSQFSYLGFLCGRPVWTDVLSEAKTTFRSASSVKRKNDPYTNMNKSRSFLIRVTNLFASNSLSLQTKNDNVIVVVLSLRPQNYTIYINNTSSNFRSIVWQKNGTTYYFEFKSVKNMNTYV